MANERMAEQIAAALRDGFIHPGDEAKGTPRRPVILPFKPVPGQPQEMTNLMDATVKLLSECIVALVEEENEIVPRAEAASMRRAVGEAPNGPSMVPVYCHCNPTEPLAILTMASPDSPIVVDGPSLLRGLAQRDTAHPHGFTPREPEMQVLRTAVVETMESMTKRQMPVSARKVITDAMNQLMGEA